MNPNTTRNQEIPIRRWLVAGAGTLAGTAVVREARRRGLDVVELTAEDTADWADAAAIERALRASHPDMVLVAAGESGGIALNQAHPARLLESNLRVVLNVICQAAREGVPRLMYLASSCCYPRDAPQPLRVEALQTGPFEPSNAAYSAAKSAGIAACEAIRGEYGLGYFAAIPSTLYGPEESFDPREAHVATGLLLRLHEAKQRGLPALSVWGTGTPRRDFLFSRDLADACLFLAGRHEAASGTIHIGPDTDLSIAEVAAIARDVVGYGGRLEFDPSKPDGAPLKRLDASALRAMGWTPRTGFAEGLRETYQAFLATAR